MQQWISFSCDAQFSKPFPCAPKAFSPVFVVLCCWKPTLGTCSTPLLSCQMIFAILFSTSGFQTFEKEPGLGKEAMNCKCARLGKLPRLLWPRNAHLEQGKRWLQRVIVAAARCWGMPAASCRAGLGEGDAPQVASWKLAAALVVASLSLAFSVLVFSEKKLLFFFWCLVYNHYILK